nr:hypothetical protein [Tanacetum cinerariifolium]
MSGSNDKDLRSSGRRLGKEVVIEPVNDDKYIDVNDEPSDDDFVDLGRNNPYASGLRRNGRNKDKEVYDSDHAKTVASGSKGKGKKQGRKRSRETAMPEAKKKAASDKPAGVKKQKQGNKKTKQKNALKKRNNLCGVLIQKEFESIADEVERSIEKSKIMEIDDRPSFSFCVTQDYDVIPVTNNEKTVLTPMPISAYTPEGEACDFFMLHEKMVTTKSNIMRSPFYGRVADANAALSNEESKVTKYLFLTNHESDTDILFKSKSSQQSNRLQMESLGRDYVETNILDTWAVDKESFSQIRNDDGRFERVLQHVESLTRGRSELNKLKKIDLVFLPVDNEGHRFLLTFDLKYGVVTLFDQKKKDKILKKAKLRKEPRLATVKTGRRHGKDVVVEPDNYDNPIDVNYEPSDDDFFDMGGLRRSGRNKDKGRRQIDSLRDELVGELILLKTFADPEEEICLIEKLLYDNSSPRPPKEFISENSDAAIKSFSPCPVPVDDSDSPMEEIDLSFTPDDPMPPGIEEDDYDYEFYHTLLIKAKSLKVILAKEGLSSDIDLDAVANMTQGGNFGNELMSGDFMTFFNAPAAMAFTDAVPSVGRSVTIAYMARILCHHYDAYPNFFTMSIPYGRRFTKVPRRKYVDGERQRDTGSRKNVEGNTKEIAKGKKANIHDKGKDKIVNEEEKDKSECPWVLYISKGDKGKWLVRPYKEEHKCLQSRKIKTCTSTFLSKHIQDLLAMNLEMPMKAIKEHMKKIHVAVSKTKAFRAKAKAQSHLKGDAKVQYSLLREYVQELKRCNPNTTNGFRAFGRKFLGLDGAFMRGQYSGQLRTAVGVDANNGIYLVAYGIVESESSYSWTWFLTCLGDDLDLFTILAYSNFTFITYRQKGLLLVTAKLFPAAEHIYYVRHIHENINMTWKGSEYKEMLYKYATACTVVEFNRHIDTLKGFNKKAYEWLKKIAPEHWSRSHFSCIHSLLS